MRYLPVQESTKAYFRRAVCVIAMSLTALSPIAAAAEDQEAAIGRQEAERLAKKGEIIESSPYYAELTPIARRIAAIADPLYSYPFKFILVHEASPNAFAVPGGSIYVTDSLMKFVENQDELAAVLCHETAHNIHHDVVHNMNKNRNLGFAATALGMLIGGAGGGLASTAIGVAANIQSLRFSRDVETQADLTGAEICSKAGYNPWGMVWLFEHFSKTGNGGQMEALSDHPTDSHRIAKLKELYANNPGRYSRYSSNIANATPLRGRSTSAVRKTQPIMRAPVPKVTPVPARPISPRPGTRPQPGSIDDEPIF